MTYNKTCGLIMLVGLAMGVYFQPGPAPGQPDLSYLLQEPALLSMEMAGAFLMSVGFVALFFGNSGK